jgi:hypothetical protein
MTKEIYGGMPGGRIAEAFTLDNGLLRAEILTFGAALNRLFAPDGDGRMQNILSTFESLEARIAGSRAVPQIAGTLPAYMPPPTSGDRSASAKCKKNPPLFLTKHRCSLNSTKSFWYLQEKQHVHFVGRCHHHEIDNY